MVLRVNGAAPLAATPLPEGRAQPAVAPVATGHNRNFRRKAGRDLARNIRDVAVRVKGGPRFAGGFAGP